MKNSKYTIYKLTDPRTNEVKYIGQTTVVLWRRLSAHVSPHSHKTKRLKDWVDSVVASGERPAIAEIATTDNSVAARVIEAGMIMFYTKSGANLCNTNNQNIKALGIFYSVNPTTEQQAAEALMKMADIDKHEIVHQLVAPNFSWRNKSK